MKRWRVSGVSCMLAGILAMAPAAFGQAVSQISGNVKDQAGAVLPGVEITATQTDTGLVRTTVSNETGNYVLPNLPLGPYKLEAALPGFRTFIQTGILLRRWTAVLSLIPFSRWVRSPNRSRLKPTPRRSKRGDPQSVRLSRISGLSNCL